MSSYFWGEKIRDIEKDGMVGVIFFLIYNDFYFFFKVFFQFSTVQHGDPVTHTYIHFFFSHYHAP